VQKPLTPVKLQKYVIDYGVIDPRLKSLATQKGESATLEFAAAAYDPDGRLLNSMLNEGQAPTGVKPGSKPGALFHAEQETGSAAGSSVDSVGGAGQAGQSDGNHGSSAAAEGGDPVCFAG